MNCNICGYEVSLVPFTKERAKKVGDKSEDYIKLFPVHVKCALDKRRQETLELIRRCYSD